MMHAFRAMRIRNNFESDDDTTNKRKNTMEETTNDIDIMKYDEYDLDSVDEQIAIESNNNDYESLDIENQIEKQIADYYQMDSIDYSPIPIYNEQKENLMYRNNCSKTHIVKNNFRYGLKGYTRIILNVNTIQEVRNQISKVIWNTAQTDCEPNEKWYHIYVRENNKTGDYVPLIRDSQISKPSHILMTD